MIGRPLVYVCTLHEPVVHEGRTDVIRVSKPDCVISWSATTEKPRPSLVVALGVDPKGHRVLGQCKLWIGWKEDPVVVSVEIEGSVPNSGQALRVAPDGCMQVVGS